MQNTLKEFVGMAEILNRGQQEVVMKSRQLIGQRKKMIGEYRAVSSSVDGLMTM